MTFQTLGDFITRPFGEVNEKSNDYESKFSKLDRDRRIKVVALTKVEDDYLLHLTIGSTTNQTESYDVVLLFFTDNDEIKKEITFKNYFVKFFSNSASFIYQYAVLYRQNGFLIDMLFDKMEEKYKDKLPDKVNKDYKLSYDSSIYMACRYLQVHGGYFNKYLNGARQKKPEVFFSEIKDFSDVKIINDIRSMDRKIDKELAENKKRVKEERRKRGTNKNSIQKTTKVSAKRNTLNSVKSSITIKPKKSSTIKRSRTTIKHSKPH